MVPLLLRTGDCLHPFGLAIVDILETLITKVTKDLVYIYRVDINHPPDFSQATSFPRDAPSRLKHVQGSGVFHPPRTAPLQLGASVVDDPSDVKDRRQGVSPQTSLARVFFVTSSYLLLVVRPGAPSSVLAPSSDARSP